ncbi:PAS domain S-box protein [Chitinophaga sp. SYP-B3965]|uniref:PAS domain-containing sensor histidine kinase n=1 Tax=Chitinophaga sp. SYP-B3965 TaxID=2663120 RepID=UPI0015632953|nr:PAS domain S-box protein [Chitinophaga sp. SYP-B3965]
MKLPASHDLKGNDDRPVENKWAPGDHQLKQILSRSPNIFLILSGPDMVVDFANEALLQSWNKDWGIMGKTLHDILPELKGQPFRQLLQDVYSTGRPYYGQEEKAVIIRNGKPTDVYYNYAHQPVIDSNGAVSSIIVMAADITEQVETRKKVEESEERFRAFVTASSSVVYRMSPDWTEMRELSGKGFLSDTGEPSTEWLNKYIHADDQLTVLNAIKSSVATRNIFEMEHRVIRNDGTIGWTFSRAIPILNTSGDVIEWFGTASDITPRKQAEEALKIAMEESQVQKRLYETIMANTPDLVYVFNLNYRFIYANTALLTMWGKSWEQAIGKGLLDNGYEPWHAEMHEREIDQVVSTMQPVRGEVFFPHVTLGKRIYDYIFVPVLNEQGEVEAIAGTTRDITDIRRAESEIRESEERFRNLADYSPMFVFIIEPHPLAPVSYWNKAWLEYTGQSFEEARGRAWNGIIHPDDIPAVMAQYDAAFNLKEEYFIPAVRVKRNDGIYRWHAFKSNPRYLSNGVFNGYVGVGLDIHEQKLNEEAVRQNEADLQQKVIERTKELQRSNEDLQQFAHVASHDLKEPVRKIRLFTSLIKEEPLPEKLNNYLGKIEKAAERMYGMIDGVLQYSSYRSIEQVFENVDLNEIVKNVENDLEIIIQEKRALMLHENLPSVYGAPVLLNQLFYNLINNSLKFSAASKPLHIEITQEKAEAHDLQQLELPPDRHYTKIILKDNGIGFNQKDADRIFQAFARLNSRDQIEGTGLGLALCRSIVERHNGAIYAEGQPDVGAQFTIILPLNAD